jgi:hypothetical protein
MSALEHLPGGELIAQGIEDCVAGRITPAACLISVGWPKLNRAGIKLQDREMHRVPDPEQELYKLLCAEGGDAYSRYNSLIRQLISFEQSLEHEQARANK